MKYIHIFVISLSIKFIYKGSASKFYSYQSSEDTYRWGETIKMQLLGWALFKYRWLIKLTTRYQIYKIHKNITNVTRITYKITEKPLKYSHCDRSLITLLGTPVVFFIYFLRFDYDLTNILVPIFLKLSNNWAHSKS